MKDSAAAAAPLQTLWTGAAPTPLVGNKVKASVALADIFRVAALMCVKVSSKAE